MLSFEPAHDPEPTSFSVTCAEGRVTARASTAASKPDSQIFMVMELLMVAAKFIQKCTETFSATIYTEIHLI